MTRLTTTVARVFAHALSAALAFWGCKTMQTESSLLETRPYFCVTKLDEHCPPPESQELRISLGTSSLFMTWPVTRSNKEQTLGLKSCTIVRRDTREEVGSCEAQAPTFDALVRGASTYYTTPVSLSPLDAGSYGLAATFYGDAGLVTVLSFLRVEAAPQ